MYKNGDPTRDRIRRNWFRQWRNKTALSWMDHLLDRDWTPFCGSYLLLYLLLLFSETSTSGSFRASHGIGGILRVTFKPSSSKGVLSFNVLIWTRCPVIPSHSERSWGSGVSGRDGIFFILQANKMSRNMKLFQDIHQRNYMKRNHIIYSCYLQDSNLRAVRQAILSRPS